MPANPKGDRIFPAQKIRPMKGCFETSQPIVFTDEGKEGATRHKNSKHAVYCKSQGENNY